ncbi:MAG: bifunctional homocysteine S-methyltransferase/methylenetetrahydrofolate reductase [Desulfobulbaceae bacterium]|uniref:Bifunctional homocysteine S-methyltransferase/methylenetetrahydrofolate reductase n=1 Tax=Candidatus Desulfobia pelagia TaxID=2841692 RepID=A0A8J6NB14_9BACT|nr:bifunctional homocysteine S-methyltransferase/methylenetetrahydrofolate reductase [Candidatus Desulfobia pelagia]
MKADFKEYIREHVLLGDGAFGSYLYEKGIDLGKNIDLLNVKNPDLIFSIHEEYIRAGSQLIETNTFGGNRFNLQELGKEDQVREINLAGVRLARKAAGHDVYVAGSVGPTGIEFPLVSEEVTEGEMNEAFSEQIGALVEGGVDIIILETFTHLEEILMALGVARKLSDLPIIAQMVYPSKGKTARGITAYDCARELLAAGASVVGTNCGRGIDPMLTAIESMAPLAESQVPLSAFPNAGLPEVIGHRMIYPAQPAYMAKRAAEMIKMGVRIIGGCCGTVPAHIHEFRSSLKLRHKKTLRSGPVHIETSESVSPQAPIVATGTGGFLEQVQKDQMPVIVELDPPTHLEIDNVLEGAKFLAESGADAVSLGENPLAILRAGNIALAHRIKEEVGVQVILHQTCRDQNGLGLQSHIMAAHILGIEAILAVTGDSASSTDQPGVNGVFDTNSFGLIRMLSRFNQGVNMAGKPVKQKTRFSIGCAFSFRPTSPKMQISRLEKKAAQGAHFVMTQPLFDKNEVEKMVELTSHLDMAIFPGIFPLISARNADFIHNEVPGITVPKAVREVLWRYADVADQRKAAMDITARLVEDISSFVDGIYLVSPLNKWDIAGRFVRQIRDAGWTGSGKLSKRTSGSFPAS